MHGLNTLEHQPAKIAAMEGHFDTRAGAPLLLVGVPDMGEERTKYAVEIPRLGSLILTHDLDGTVRGLKEWPPAERPNALLLFWSFRVMVGLGVAMFAMGVWSLALRLRQRLYASPLLLKATIAMSPAGLIAVIAGWLTTEAGRQPYTVYGLLTTADSASPVGAAAVGASLAAFVVVYFLVFGAGVFYMLRLMTAPPRAAEDDLAPGEPLRAGGLMPAPIRAGAAGAARPARGSPS
jgi:cytochrome d ubiquinol oxidase subunit I